MSWIALDSARSGISGVEIGRPRSHSEGAAFQNSYDYTIPYEEYGGKNGAELALELLGARDAPFDSTGHLRVPSWVGEALAYPPVPKALSAIIKPKTQGITRRNTIFIAPEDEEKLEGVEEVVALGSQLDALDISDYETDSVEKADYVPRIIHELVADKVVPDEFADLPPEEIAKMFQIKPRSTPRLKTEEHTVTYTSNAEGRVVIEYATLPQVVKIFSTDAQDNNSIQRLILAHEHFVDSRVMFDQFTDFFSSHQSASAPDQIIQARVLNVLKRWVEVSWQRMKDLGLEPLMNTFMESVGNSRFKSILEKAIHDAETQLLAEKSDSFVSPGSPTPIKAKRAKLKKGETWSLTDFDSLEIARQLTIIDMELAQQVNLQEMLKAQWVDDGAPSLFAASKRVNDLTYWLAHQILSTKELKKRVKMITHIIKIAKHLLSLNSFNSFMAVYLAFNLASTARLTKTWTNVPARHFQVWKKLSRIMSPMQNFGAYREHVQTIQPPMIICQEVMLKDLLYEEEGRPDFVNDDVLDMTKMDSIGRIVDHFRLCRSKPYALAPMPTLKAFLKEIPSWDSPEDAANQLDELSRILEPASINFPTSMNNDPANRVKSLGTLPTAAWKRDTANEGADRLQLSNPKPTPRSATLEEPAEPLSPRSAVIAARPVRLHVTDAVSATAGAGNQTLAPPSKGKKATYRTTSPKHLFHQSPPSHSFAPSSDGVLELTTSSSEDGDS